MKSLRQPGEGFSIRPSICFCGQISYQCLVPILIIVEMKVQFSKMSGAGNDFVVIDNRSRKIKDGAKAAQHLCDRRWGIGADGLLLLENSKEAAYRMMYYNADGSYGGMCGNGGRCIATFAHQLAIAPPNHWFEALDFVYHANVNGDSVALRMKNPKATQLNIQLTRNKKRVRCHFVDTGAPHVVLFLEELRGPKDLEKVDISGLGKWLRYQRRFKPAGTNVNVVESYGVNSLKIRTYERGVENETLACGTGAIAAAVVAAQLRGFESPVRVLPKSGYEMQVRFERQGDGFRDVVLVGPAVVTFEGSIELNV